MLERQEALSLLRKHIHKENLVKHMLATEVCMRRLAERHQGNLDEWSLAGLLHDIDYELTADSPQKHGIVSMDLLPKEELSQEILDAIKSHSGHCERNTPMAKALYAIDPLTGLIVASALMTPSRKLADLSAETVMKRYKEKRFAAGACREQIASCAELGLSLEEFLAQCVEAMQSASEELGL
jgi:uncharacterized protein